MSDSYTINVETIVAARDNQPYVVITKTTGDNIEKIGQFGLAEARNIANDIILACSRAEADAMLFKFFKEKELPLQACAAMMHDFRQFRYEIDNKFFQTSVSEPSFDSLTGFDFTKVNQKKN